MPIKPFTTDRLRQWLAKPLFYYVLLAVLVAVVGRVGLRYALERTFQVDEFQMAQNAVLLSRGGEWLDYAPIRPFYLVLASRLLNAEWSTVANLSVLRTLFFMLLMVNMLLIASVQPFFRGRWGRLGTMAAACLLFPMWEHGIEIRSDNVTLFCQLCGLGCVFAALRAKGHRRLGWLLMLGLASAGVHYSTAKGVALWPVQVAIGLAACWLSEGGRPWREAFGWAVGVLCGLLLGALLVWLLNYISGTLRPTTLGGGFKPDFVRLSLQTSRFSASPLLKMEVLKNPAVIIGCGLAVVEFFAKLKQGWRPGMLPAIVCAGYFFWSLFFIFINPTPYPYNMLHVAPFAFIFVLSVVPCLARQNPAILGLLAVVQVLAFVRETHASPFFRHGNFQQTSYIDAAEYLTPIGEPVLDGVGMVTSRPPAARYWWLHSMYMGAYHEGRRDNFAEIMREKWPPVVITNYRWRWLKGEELEILRANYLETSPDFHVLGAKLHEGQPFLDLVRAGRYIVRLDNWQTDRLLIDGQASEDGQFVRLAAGRHAVETRGGGEILWVNEGTEHFPPLIVPPMAKLFVKP